MLIEVLSEDRSAIPVLDKLLGDVLERRQEKHDIRFHPHRGLGFLPDNLQAPPTPNKTGLYDLLPAKLRAYEHLSEQLSIIIVIVHDADENNPNDCYKRLEYLLRTLSPSHFFVIGIAVEEMEAWLLGDFEAIRSAYPEADDQVWRSYKQDDVCGTWEKLAQVIEGKKKSRELIRVGYPAIGIYKGEWAQSIAPHLSAATNSSPSLAAFLSRFEKVLDMANEGSPKAGE